MLNAELEFAKREVNKNVDNTLQELDHQQSERIKALINHLLICQKEVFNNILNQVQQGQREQHNRTAPESQFFKEWLIQGVLVNPIEAVTHRKRSIDNYLKRPGLSGSDDNNSGMEIA